MASYVQRNRKGRVTTPVGEDVLLLNGLSGTEETSRPFRFQVELIAENKKKAPFDAMLGEKATVRFLRADECVPYRETDFNFASRSTDGPCSRRRRWGRIQVLLRTSA